jgi:hypothetical protein
MFRGTLIGNIQNQTKPEFLEPIRRCEDYFELSLQWAPLDRKKLLPSFLG